MALTDIAVQRNINLRYSDGDVSGQEFSVPALKNDGTPATTLTAATFVMKLAPLGWPIGGLVGAALTPPTVTLIAASAGSVLLALSAVALDPGQYAFTIDVTPSVGTIQLIATGTLNVQAP